MGIYLNYFNEVMVDNFIIFNKRLQIILNLI